MQVIYPFDSIGIPISVTDKGIAVTMSYTLNAIMNNPAAGYGVLWCTMFDVDGVVVNDSLGAPIENIHAQYSGNPAQQGQLTVREGVLLPGRYSIQPYYGVNTAGGTIDWRKMAIQWITVTDYTARTDLPVA